jgi:hypothetical protein
MGKTIWTAICFIATCANYKFAGIAKQTISSVPVKSLQKKNALWTKSEVMTEFKRWLRLASFKFAESAKVALRNLKVVYTWLALVDTSSVTNAEPITKASKKEDTPVSADGATETIICDIANLFLRENPY